jgi:hypothetical protein
MPLYHVQDADRPLWVIATSMADAVSTWKDQIVYEDPENYPKPEDVEEPQGVTLICGVDDLILSDKMEFFDQE